MPGVARGRRDVTSSGSGVRDGTLRPAGRRTVDAQLRPGCSSPARVANGGADQVEEVPLDPLAREVVRDGEHERVTVELRAADLAEPGWKVVSLSASRSRAATSFQRLSAVSSIAAPRLLPAPSSRVSGWASIAACERALNEDFAACPRRTKARDLQGISPAPHDSPQLWTTVTPARVGVAFSTAFVLRAGLWTTVAWNGPAILARGRSGRGRTSFTGHMKRTYQPNVRKRKRRSMASATACRPAPAA